MSMTFEEKLEERRLLEAQLYLISDKLDRAKKVRFAKAPSKSLKDLGNESKLPPIMSKSGSQAGAGMGQSSSGTAADDWAVAGPCWITCAHFPSHAPTPP